jgi:hypothetical protein
MINNLLLPNIEKSLMIVEKGIQIYDIEYILLHYYNFFYYNHDDPHKDTQHKIGELSDGVFHFSFFMYKNNPIKYMSRVNGAEGINGDYVFGGKEMMCYSAEKLLRSYKINNIRKRIKK